MKHAGASRRARLSLKQLAAEVEFLRRRVEDLEDARDLDAAIRRNSGRPLIPWEEIRKDPGMNLSKSQSPGD